MSRKQFVVPPDAYHVPINLEPRLVEAVHVIMGQDRVTILEDSDTLPVTKKNGISSNAKAD
ncbi:hypothetical protein [Pseudomonas phage D6]|nr:hypothetical protein [Pseudomonas phage D6]